VAVLKVSVPATSANLGAGFDCAGIALNLANDLYFSIGKADASGFPADATPLSGYSLAHRGFKLVLEKTGRKMPPDLRIAILAKVPRSRGLGSSATLTVAGIVAANALLEADLSEEEIVTLASQLEGHPDNAAPAYLGGLVVSIASAEGIKYRQVKPQSDLRAIVAVPDFELATSAARKVLPSKVSRQDAVFNTGRFGLFMTAILTGDYRLLGEAMEDRLHQPYRMPLVPGLQEVMGAARAQGALGSCLSGAGPSVLAFCHRNQEAIGRAMQEAWRKAGIKAEIYSLGISLQGTTYSFL